MIVTEEEAKTKRCQESYAAARALTDGGHIISKPELMGGVAIQYTAPAMCIGSACMAWRWQDSQSPPARSRRRRILRQGRQAMSAGDIVGWSMIWLGSGILCVCVVVDFMTIPMPDWHEPPWSPPPATISDVLSQLDNEEAADNVPLTLHESPNSWCGPPLPYHHPTITTEGTITNG